MAELVYIGKEKDKERPTYEDFEIVYDTSRFEIDVDRLHFLLPRERKFLAHQLGMKDWEKLTIKELNDDKWIDRLRTYVLNLPIQPNNPEIEVIDPIPIYTNEYSTYSGKRLFSRLVGGKPIGLQIVFGNKGIPIEISDYSLVDTISLQFDKNGVVKRRMYFDDFHSLDESWDEKGRKSIRYSVNQKEVSEDEYRSYLNKRSGIIEKETLLLPDITRSIIGKYLY